MADANNGNEEFERTDLQNHVLNEPPINKKDLKLITQLKREHEATIRFNELSLNRSERLRIIETVMTYGLDEDKRAPWKRSMLIHEYVRTGLPPKGL